MFRIPLRAWPERFALIEIVTVPFPELDVWVRIVIQSALAVALHWHPAGAETCSVAVVPALETSTAAPLTVKVQIVPAGCVNEKLYPAIVIVPVLSDVERFGEIFTVMVASPAPDVVGTVS